MNPDLYIYCLCPACAHVWTNERATPRCPECGQWDPLRYSTEAQALLARRYFGTQMRAF